MNNKSSSLVLAAFFLCFAVGLFVCGSIKQWLAYASAALLAVWIIKLAITTDFLRDDSHVESGKKPFSFSRSQLAYWSFLIIGGYIVIYLNASGESSEILNSTSLILLGIGGATTTAASVIDSNDKTKTDTDKQAIKRHQDTESEGFMTDILSDQDGISIHRLQALVFNLVYGGILIYSVLMENKMPVFESEELGLLGLSAGTYTILKVNENKSTTK